MFLHASPETPIKCVWIFWKSDVIVMLVMMLIMSCFHVFGMVWQLETCLQGELYDFLGNLVAYFFRWLCYGVNTFTEITFLWGESLVMFLHSVRLLV